MISGTSGTKSRTAIVSEDRPAGGQDERHERGAVRVAVRAVERVAPGEPAEQPDARRARTTPTTTAIASVWAVSTNWGMIGGQACEPGFAFVTPTKPQSGRSRTQKIAGPRIATRGASGGP